MKDISLTSRVASGRSTPTVPSSTSRGRFAEIFSHGDSSVKPIRDLASAVREIAKVHPGGADLILLGRSTNQGMKIIRDSWGFISLLIGLRRDVLETLSAGDEVVVAFNHGAIRAGAVIGFLWEGGSGADSGPSESNSTSSNPRQYSVRHFLRHNLP